jgi:amino acid transporter
MASPTVEHKPPGLGAIVKRLLVGAPISSHEELHHRLNKRVALAIFSSDALSSSAYATDEILLALVLAGSLAIGRSVPIGIAVVVVLSIVVISYRQIIHAYPAGGGAYIVASDNLGVVPGLIAASSLFIDYVLTVSVSVAAAVAAMGAAFPGLLEHRVVAALGMVVVITVLNLRGLKESGTIFAIPSYGFLISVGMMILVGVVRVATGHYTPIRAHPIAAEQALTMLLVLRAFSSGCTALTGVEAISNGVPAFRKPEARNASQTLLMLGFLLAYLFLGITFLAHFLHVDPGLIEHGKTVTSQIAQQVFGSGSLFFYLVQAFTAMILFLAANTSYAGFPRLASILAQDRFLPRVLQNRGDKLAYSNGIVVLAAAAAGVLINYGARVHRIIPLYVIGVFTSFTLAQSGMVVRWFRLKGKSWRRSAVVNGVGAFTTFVVLIVVSRTKFSLGAWQVIILIPAIAGLLYLIRSHYLHVARTLRLEVPVADIQTNRVVVLASSYPGATVKALAFTRAFGAEETRVVAVGLSRRELSEARARWDRLGLRDEIIEIGDEIDDLVGYVGKMQPTATNPVTVVIPDPQYPSRLEQLRKQRKLLRIKGALLYTPGIVVISIPFRPGYEMELDKLRAPARFSVIVLVSAVHRATIRALKYARSLHPSELKAVSIATDSQEAERMESEWAAAGLEVGLEIVDSPYRSIIQPLLKEIDDLRTTRDDAIGVVIPEFVPSRWWHTLLHNQTAFMIKTALLFEPNVIVINVPYRIPPRSNKEAPPESAETLIEEARS